MNRFPNSKIVNANDTQPIRLFNQYGGIVNGYVPFIIRPLDNVQVPRDFKRGSFEEKCDWPLFGGSKYQKWCSEDNAMNYYAMQPILNPDNYNEGLKKLFKIVVGNNGVYWAGNNGESIGGSNNIPKNSLTTVNCGSGTNKIMSYIMTEVAKAVMKIPEFQKNSSWKVDQFHNTDPTFYSFLSPQGVFYYIVLFNLYNPLRSISTMVEAVVLVDTTGPSDPLIVYFDFINKFDWKMDGTNGLLGEYSGISTNFNDPMPTDVQWNYGNTLLKQEFNQYGFYEPGNNVGIKGGVPESLKNTIKNIENNDPSYLIPAGKAAFTGVINSPGSFDYKKMLIVPNNGTVRNVNSNPNPVYEMPLELDKSGNFIRNRVPPSSVIGLINT